MGNSLPGDRREIDDSGHGKKAIERGTHSLKIAGRGTTQDMERNRPNKGNSPAGDHRGDNSGHRKKAIERGVLTNLMPQRVRQVTIRKESGQASGTHFLYNAEGGTKSGHGKKVTDSEGGALTLWGSQREGQVRTQEEKDRAKEAHCLETTEGGTSHDTE